MLACINSTVVYSACLSIAQFISLQKLLTVSNQHRPHATLRRRLRRRLPYFSTQDATQVWVTSGDSSRHMAVHDAKLPPVDEDNEEEEVEGE